jgi:DNA polymerase sigma
VVSAVLNVQSLLLPKHYFFYFAGPEDKIICEDGVECTFLRDISGLHHILNASLQDPNIANLSLAQLFTDFLEFFALFDYNRGAVCVVTGEIQPRRRKEQRDPKKVSYFLDITNPMEPQLNVCANVQDMAVQKFRRKCDQTLRKMNQVQQLQVKDTSLTLNS